MSLSDDILTYTRTEFIQVEDVKDFIKKLKAGMIPITHTNLDNGEEYQIKGKFISEEFINKLVGVKLTGKPVNLSGNSTSHMKCEFECKECGRLLDEEYPYCQDCDEESYEINKISGDKLI